MPHDPVEQARAALAEGRPDDALQHLGGLQTAAAHWVRALAAAQLADPLRTRLALRDTLAAGRPVPSAIVDVARRFAEALLEDEPGLGAWHLLAAAVYAEIVQEEAPPPLHLAWDLCVRAAEDAPMAQRPGLVVAMAAIRRELGHEEEATRLARGAQDLARREGDAEAFASASLLLADVCGSDEALAADVTRHAHRLLQREWGEAPARDFQERLARIARTRSES